MDLFLSFMALPTLDQMMVFLGYSILIFVGVLIVLAVVMLTVTFISMRRGRFYLPWLLQPGLDHPGGAGQDTVEDGPDR